MISVPEWMWYLVTGLLFLNSVFLGYVSYRILEERGYFGSWRFWRKT